MASYWSYSLGRTTHGREHGATAERSRGTTHEREDGAGGQRRMSMDGRLRKTRYQSRSATRRDRGYLGYLHPPPLEALLVRPDGKRATQFRSAHPTAISAHSGR